MPKISNMRFMGRFSNAVSILIGINVLLFLVGYVPGLHEPIVNSLALYFPRNEHFKAWQVVTNMFLHGGIGHILLNMYALWAFGSPLEYRWGTKRFTLFYFLSGIGASVLYLVVNYFKFDAIYNDLIAIGITPDDIQQLLVSGKYDTAKFSSISTDRLSDMYNLYNTPAVGASGAIYGILVAFGISYPNAKLALIFLPVPIAAKYFIPALIALDLFSGVTGIPIFGGGIAHFAHVGGALIGFLLMLLWRKKARHNSPEY